MEELVKFGLQLAGVSQLLLFFGSFAIPRCLQWSERTACLIPFMRQLFFTYAFYILGSHLLFACLSIFFADDLMNGNPLGIMMLAFMGLWWSGRIVCQFFYFDRSAIPENLFNKLAEGVLITMFFCLAIVYFGTLIWILIF